MVSQRYRGLMNARYDRIVGAASWAGSTLEASYDGSDWSASVARGPARTRDRWVTGTGETLELALTDLETRLGLDRWAG